MEGRELHRFPKGQTCSECPARRYYLESGFRYCQNGHRVEGFVEYDIDLEGDNYGQSGAVSRKAREKREKQRKHLEGDAARELYLECLQVVLRKQLAWLVRERGVPRELEGVVRGLWEVRVGGFGGLRMAGGEEGKGKGKAVEREGSGSRSVKSEPVSGTESDVFFSSQGEGDVSSGGEGGPVRGSRVKSWVAKQGQTWPLPTLMDTLALCYVGCMVMRLPVRIGDLFRWARSGRLLFVQAIAEVPMKMRDRLKPQYQNALRGKYSSLTGGELHTAVTDLVMGYRKNYDMVFPPLNTPPILLRYLRELALPLEVYVYTEKLVSLLRLDFSIPTNPHVPTKNPETLLIASIVLVVKVLYPFHNGRSSAGGLEIDWTRWADKFETHEPQRHTRRDFEKMKSAEVYDMTPEDMDSYLDWFQETKIMPEQDERELQRLFPLTQPSPPPNEGDPEEKEADVEARIDELRKHIVWAPPGSDDEDDRATRASTRHRRYATCDDLSGPAKVFHEKAAEYSGLSVEKLLKTVLRLEQKLLYWQQVERKGIDIDMEDIEEGVPGRPLARFLGVKEL